MKSLSLVMAYGPCLGVMLFGLFMIAGGEFLLAIREIAMNTRKDEEESGARTHFRSLSAVAKIYIVIGYVTIVLGAVLSGIITIVLGAVLTGLLNN